MSHSSPVQCLTYPLSEKLKNKELAKTDYGSKSHMPFVSTMTEPAPMSQKTVASGAEITTTATHLLDQAARRISWANSPLIVAGSGILHKSVEQQFVEFATCLEIPIISTVAAQSIGPKARPLWRGTISSPKIHHLYGFDWASLVITVGCDAEDCLPEFWNPDGDIPILHIDSSSAIKNAYYWPTLELVGNLTFMLKTLLRHSHRQGQAGAYTSL